MFCTIFFEIVGWYWLFFGGFFNLKLPNVIEEGAIEEFEVTKIHNNNNKILNKINVSPMFHKTTGFEDLLSLQNVVPHN
jgi:hypothetical protein